MALPHGGALDAYRPFVSVIVPVFNDAERLRQCLAALEAQSYPRQQYEVIVVDNGSDPPVELGAEAPNTVLLVEPRPGSYAARNAGIARSRGEILAFTDSDCRPSGDWLAKAVESLGRLGCDGIVAGGIEQSTPGRPAFSLAELYATTFWLRQAHYSKVLGSASPRISSPTRACSRPSDSSMPR